MEQPSEMQPDHDLLIRMDEKLNGIVGTLSNMDSKVEKHETRITLQEKHSERQDGAISALKWALGAFIGLVGIGIPILIWLKG